MKKIIIFGDSTTSDYAEDSFPQQGWAHYLPQYVNEGIKVRNFARGGASLKNFLFSQDYVDGKSGINKVEECPWNRAVLPEVSEGDIVIFYWAGINDMLQSNRDSYRECTGGAFVRDWQNTARESYIWIGEGLGTHTYFTVRSEVQEMAALLRKMVEQVRDKKAIPIIIKGTGKYYKVHGQDKNVIAVNRKYAKAVINVAKDCGIEHYDMGAWLEQKFAQMGYEKVLQEYLLPISTVTKMRADSGIHKPVPLVDDNVHYNCCGAEAICREVVAQAKKSNGVLSEVLR